MAVALLDDIKLTLGLRAQRHRDFERAALSYVVSFDPTVSREQFDVSSTRFVVSTKAPTTPARRCSSVVAPTSKLSVRLSITLVVGDPVGRRNAHSCLFRSPATILGFAEGLKVLRSTPGLCQARRGWLTDHAALWGFLCSALQGVVSTRATHAFGMTTRYAFCVRT